MLLLQNKYVVEILTDGKRQTYCLDLGMWYVDIENSKLFLHSHLHFYVIRQK